MKLKKEFIVYNKKGETLLIATGAAEFSGIVQGNKTFGAVLDLLREDTTVEKIVEAMFERFQAEKDVIRADVEKAIAELKKIGALDE